jgi:hypothetical protein
MVYPTCNRLRDWYWTKPFGFINAFTIHMYASIKYTMYIPYIYRGNVNVQDTPGTEDSREVPCLTGQTHEPVCLNLCVSFQCPQAFQWQGKPNPPLEGAAAGTRNLPTYQVCSRYVPGTYRMPACVDKGGCGWPSAGPDPNYSILALRQSLCLTSVAWIYMFS